MEVSDFSEIAGEFRRRVEQTQWATMTTVDERGRPRGRLVHPVWEEPVGWLATGRRSFKAGHLARNPYVSLAYWDQAHEQIYAEKAEGYPLDHFFRRPDHPEYGLLRLDPWRIELWDVKGLFAQTPPQVWRPADPVSG